MRLTPEMENDIRTAIALIDGVAEQFANALPDISVAEAGPEFMATMAPIAVNLGDSVKHMNNVLDIFGLERQKRGEWIDRE